MLLNRLRSLVPKFRRNVGTTLTVVSCVISQKTSWTLYEDFVRIRRLFGSVRTRCFLFRIFRTHVVACLGSNLDQKGTCHYETVFEIPVKHTKTNFKLLAINRKIWMRNRKLQDTLTENIVKICVQCCLLFISKSKISYHQRGKRITYLQKISKLI